MNSFKHARGFTLIETIAAIVIGMIVMSGVYAMINMATRSTRTSSMITELTQVTGAMSAKYVPAAKTVNAPYAAASTADIIAGVSTFVNVTAGTAATPFATPLTIAPANLFGTTGDSYVVQFKVPVAACLDVINQESNLFDGAAAGTASNYVQAPSGTTATLPAGVTAGTQPTPAQIATACGTGAGYVAIYLYKV